MHARVYVCGVIAGAYLSNHLKQPHRTAGNARIVLATPANSVMHVQYQVTSNQAVVTAIEGRAQFQRPRKKVGKKIS